LFDPGLTFNSCHDAFNKNQVRLGLLGSGQPLIQLGNT
jgi:hypothetical protein